MRFGMARGSNLCAKEQNVILQENYMRRIVVAT